MSAATTTTTFTPTADAYVSSAAPTTNYGADPLLTIGKNPSSRAYLTFNISGLTGIVASAQLVLHAETSGTGFNLVSAPASWSEGTITYANAPAVGPVNSKYKSFAAGATLWISASGLARGNGTVGMALVSGNTTNISFDSKEATAAGTAPPLLQVTTYPPTQTPAPSPTPTPGGTNPIQHIVIFYQENHSFDNVLGTLCKNPPPGRSPCDGSGIGDSAPLSTGGTVTIKQAPDIVVGLKHNSASQQTAINGGAMNGFDKIGGCTSAQAYACFNEYAPSQVPNLSSLATNFALSDRTFSLSTVPSWGAHTELVAGTLDGFVGDNPLYNGKQSPPPPPAGAGWGCDSNRDGLWTASPGATPVEEPACVPDPGCSLQCTFPADHSYGGAYRSTPVGYVPTIMDELDAALPTPLSWKLYTTPGMTSNGLSPANYSWAICPTFAECLYSQQSANMVDTSQFVTDAQAGNLPNFSVLLPTSAVAASSQHNGTSMAEGDNWMGYAMSALMNGPDWGSTAVFIVYDDCGCFYDHVPPPPGNGIRLPVVIVSPYAISGYTDSNVASLASLLAYTEHTFNLQPLSATGPDATAYDYKNAFNYNQVPLAPIATTQQPISTAERNYLAAHPPDSNDPT